MQRGLGFVSSSSWLDVLRSDRELMEMRDFEVDDVKTQVK